MRDQASPLFPLPEEVTCVSSGCFVAHGSCFPVLVISLTATTMLGGAGILPGILHGALGHVPQAQDSQSLAPVQDSQSLEPAQAGRPPSGVTSHPLWQLVCSAVIQNRFL